MFNISLNALTSKLLCLWVLHVSASCGECCFCNCILGAYFWKWKKNIRKGNAEKNLFRMTEVSECYFYQKQKKGISYLVAQVDDENEFSFFSFFTLISSRNKHNESERTLDIWSAYAMCNDETITSFIHFFFYFIGNYEQSC